MPPLGSWFQDGAVPQPFQLLDGAARGRGR